METEPDIRDATDIPSKEHHETIYDILMDQDEITWQSIIMQLIKTEQMDPWDISITQLSRMFIKTLKKFKELNLALSGKILLAAALLLRIKSSRLVGEDLMEFDRLLASGETDDLYTDEEFMDSELSKQGLTYHKPEDWKLVPKTPQPRKRKVSVYDLIDALAIALTVRRRRILNQIEPRTVHRLPDKRVDISRLIDDLHNDVMEYLESQSVEKMAFSDLLPAEAGKHDKVLTFIPLLHLTNARKTDLEQHNHFGEIWVKRVTEETRRMMLNQIKKEEQTRERKEKEETKLKTERKKKREEVKKRREEKEAKKSEEAAQDMPQENQDEDIQE